MQPLQLVANEIDQPQRQENPETCLKFGSKSVDEFYADPKQELRHSLAQLLEDLKVHDPAIPVGPSHWIVISNFSIPG